MGPLMELAQTDRLDIHRTGRVVGGLSARKKGENELKERGKK